MNLFRCIVIIPVMALCVSCTAQSQDDRAGKGKKPPSFKKLIEKMDANKDGKLAKAEIKGPLKEGFDRLDENKDGYITEEELKRGGPPKRPRRNN